MTPPRTKPAWISLALAACQAAQPGPAQPASTVLEPRPAPKAEPAADSGTASRMAEDPPGWDGEEWLRSGPLDPARETPAHWRRRSFRRLIAQFEGQELDTPEWPGLDRQALIPVVMNTALRAILDVEKRWTPAEDYFAASKASKVTGDEHMILAREGTGRFRRGEFRAWDEYVRLSGIDPQMTASFSDPLPPRTFLWPESFYPLASSFARQAWAMLPAE